MSDPVNRPDHYTKGPVEVIDIIEQIVNDFKGADAYNAGCVIKYIARAPYKGDYVENLRKAKWYLDNLLMEYVDIDTGAPLAQEDVVVARATSVGHITGHKTKPPRGKIAVTRNGKTYYRKRKNK